MAELEDLKELEELTISRPSFSDNGMGSIGKLAAMRDLQLYGGRTRVNDKNMKSIRPLHNLEHLTVFEARVSDASIALLLSFKHLKRLSLYDTKFTNNGRDKLRKGLAQCDITVK